MNPRLPANEIFRLRPPRNPRLSGTHALASIQKLKEITPDCDGAAAENAKNRVEELKHCLQASRQNGLSWIDATNVPRREWTLLRLYTLHLGTTGADEWLCKFDEAVAESVLGTDGRRWHPSRRRDVTNLFFVQFDRLAALPQIAHPLVKAWDAEEKVSRDESSRIWKKKAGILFDWEGPNRVAGFWKEGENVDDLADRFAIPKTSLFREMLFQSVLLRRLRGIRLFEVNRELFREIENSKATRFRHGRTLGSCAVEILVERVMKEAKELWEPAWSRQLVPFACDPRTLNLAERERWWGWANQDQRKAAVKALTGLNIKEFIRLLEDSLKETGSEHQFKRRSDFLLWMFTGGLIEDAKLVVHADLYGNIDAATKQSLQPSRAQGGGQRTSFVCLKCAGGVNLIEGTHNFGLRGFREGRFPINTFWESAPRAFEDGSLRVSENRCDIYQRHSGEWESSFIDKLRNKLRIEWPRFRR